MNEFKKCNKCGKELPATNEYFYYRNKNKGIFHNSCKECEGFSFTVNPPNGFKKCNKCEKLLPKTIEYFGKDKSKRDGLNGTCRKCLGSQYINQSIIEPNEGFKICNQCIRELDFSNFHKDSSKKDGLRTICKECTAKTQKQYYESNGDRIKEYSQDYYVRNREEILERTREYAELNPEKIRKSKKEYYEKNKEERILYIKGWQEENPRKTKLYKEKWKKENPDKIREKNKAYYSRPEVKERMNFLLHKKRAKMRKLPATLTKQEWSKAKAYFNHKCAYCGSHEKLTKDHFIPVYKNGGYTKDNIIPVCKSCNCRKNRTDFSEWYPKQEFYCKEREEKVLRYLNGVSDTEGGVSNG